MTVYGRRPVRQEVIGAGSPFAVFYACHPLSETMAVPARRPATEAPRRFELKKHVGAVHVKGTQSFLERKVSNVLLLHAYDDLPKPEVFEHEIRLKRLAELAGFDSNDHALLRESLEALAGTTITWNVLDAEGKEEWGVSTFLAQAVVKNGTCRYAYAPDLRKKLYNPEIYARINLSVQEQFGSGYALALYENCVRFRRVGSTGWIDVETWRDLLGVMPGQYEPFKYFNRDVLKPAVDEVNRYSDIRVTMERRRERRRVVALKFAIEENEQLMLDLEGGAARVGADGPASLPPPRERAPTAETLFGPLQRRLLAFGLTDAQAMDTSTEYEAERVERNLAYVEAEVGRGRKITNVAAFTLGAIRADYGGGGGETEVERAAATRQAEAAEASRQTSRRKAKAEADVRAEARRVEGEAQMAAAGRAAMLDARWAALSAAERAEIEAAGVERLRRENALLWGTRERERVAGVEDGSIAVRSLLRAYRDEALGGP